MSGAGEDVSGRSGSGRTARLPRWTRQEILVLIEGKRVVEARGRGRGRVAGGAGSELTKWAAVAEYCRRHGVERGAVQCRKRWSNLAGDYKRIREWEGSLPSAGAGKEVSFWAMRNDARRERRLPGFFDLEVYDIIEGRGGGGGGGGVNAAVVRAELLKEGKEKAAVLDSGRAAAPPEDALCSSPSSSTEEDEKASAPAPASAQPITPVPPPAPAPAPAVVAVPISEKNTGPPRQESSEQGTSKGKQQEQITNDPPPSQGGQKRRRSDDAPGQATDLQGQLIEILGRNSQILAAQLEAQNINCQLDREQRKDQGTILLGVLGKVADALDRIADKL